MPHFYDEREGWPTKRKRGKKGEGKADAAGALEVREKKGRVVHARRTRHFSAAEKEEKGGKEKKKDEGDCVALPLLLSQKKTGKTKRANLSLFRRSTEKRKKRKKGKEKEGKGGEVIFLSYSKIDKKKGSDWKPPDTIVSVCPVPPGPVRSGTKRKEKERRGGPPPGVGKKKETVSRARCPGRWGEAEQRKKEKKRRRERGPTDRHDQI